MVSTTDLKKTLGDTRPFYAVAGVVDLTVEQLRAVPTYARSIKVERGDVEQAVAELRSETRALPTRATTAALEAVERAEDTYGDLVRRGRSVVGRIRRQQASQDLEASAPNTVSRTKAATTTARRSATNTGTTAKRATGRTATTARKNAASTRTATKGAATSARKTAKAAGRAVEDGAAKVG
jgi:hypothetical protein